MTKHGREPIIWFDKVCVDQNNIQDTLTCLPVFLSGCKRLLILCGPTYLNRLWCLMELFVFMSMGGSVDKMTFCFVDDSLQQGGSRDWISRFENFDVGNADCYDLVQRDQLLGIIGA